MKECNRMGEKLATEKEMRGGGGRVLQSDPSVPRTHREIKGGDW